MIKELFVDFGIFICRDIDGVRLDFVILWFFVISVVDVGVIDFFFLILVFIVNLGFFIGILVW